MQQCLPHIISIEGNIGAGKSTLYEQLRTMYRDNPRIVFVDEPVDEWNTIVDESGTTILQRYYENQEKYAFSFQIMALGTRLSLMKKAKLFMFLFLKIKKKLKF